MDCVNYLKKYQEIPYNIFKNALENNRFFHAYLLSGPTGTPIFEIAKFLSKCLLNNKHELKEEDNIISKTVENRTYPDLIIIDTKKEQVKIDDIRRIEDKFSQTSINQLGIKIYIINLIENLRPNEANALLKFLEEPLDNTYAILTTENEYSILPTILSRTEIVRFSSVNKNDLIDECIKLGVNKKDAEILTFFQNDASMIKEEIENEDYLEAKKYVENFINLLPNKEKLRFFVLNEINPNLKTKIQIRLFIDLLIIYLKEANKMKLKENIIIGESKDKLNVIISNVNSIDDAILKLMNYRYELSYNLNSQLLFLNLIESIFGA
ncbi:MAG: hypothetical protein SPI36_05625 [Candidatus Onthovivens sp.]|nr:hypothetical protein [Mollicutes bacterium]MDD7546158.1 hypothetical protein [Bacilli bacterium]MDY2725097.1 hypothetical protein [Candidatus Onthovivens sp.]MCI7267988.1 hypothetical protein [Mollicutes bacterium]MCI7527561.1 hypothetical protein [Mollicutes bacterium]